MTQRKALGRKMYKQQHVESATAFLDSEPQPDRYKIIEPVYLFTESDFEAAIKMAVEEGEGNIDRYGEQISTWNDIWPELKKRILGE